MLTIILITLLNFNQDSILMRAGSNAPEIKKFIGEAKENGFQDWAEFLLSAMPDVDLVNLKSADFINYFHALKKNYERAPWRNRIDDNLFYYYILPYRVSQEPLENFTAYYADTLYHLVRKSKNMREAVLRINEWVFTKMKYEPTEQWDQNAITTIKRGIGRCEEMSILFIKALRTVCIPCRHTYTPWWPFTNSNHAWVEVWADGKWHSLGGGELTDLDNAWFRIPAQRAAIIKSIVYGEIADKKEMIDRKDKKFTVINSTPNYGEVVKLNVQVRKNNIPVESAQVSINVYNYSSLVPVGSKKTDCNGYVYWVVGKTDLFIYAYKDTMLGYYIWRPAKTINDTVVINVTKREIPDTSFWLYTRKISSKNPKSKYKPDVDRLKELQNLHFNFINIDSLLLQGISDTVLKRIFKDAKANARPLIQFYFSLPDTFKDFFIHYFKVLVSKDIVALDTTGLCQELYAVKKSILMADKQTPDSIIKNYVIPSRILYEHLDKWRNYIQQIINDNLPFVQSLNLSITERVDSLFSWVENNIEKKKTGDAFGPMMNPLDVDKAKRATDIERYVFIVGVLRSQGIPARIKWSFDAVEYWDNGWQEKRFEQKQEKKNVWVGIKFKQDTIDLTSNANYYQDYSITRFKETTDRLEPIIDSLNGYQIVTLDSQPSYIISGWRNGFGDTYVRLKKFIPASDTTRIIINTDIPEDIKPGDLIVREYRGLIGINKLGIKNKDLASGNVLIVIFDTESEAAKSTLRNAWQDINLFKGKVYLLAVTNDKERAQVFLKANDIYKGGLYLITDAIYKNWGIRDLPSILLLKNNKAVFWIEGLNLHLSSLLQHFQE
ncbi:MAG: transglutaminase-like domain-containing protein [candidate division WOR-3 bacterium]